MCLSQLWMRGVVYEGLQLYSSQVTKRRTQILNARNIFRNKPNTALNSIESNQRSRADESDIESCFLSDDGLKL